MQDQDRQDRSKDLRSFTWSEVYIVVVVILCIVGSLLMAASRSWGTPVPKHAPKHVPTAPTPSSHPCVGTWLLTWQGGTGKATFRPKGGYTCEWSNKDWIGCWSIKDGRLTVTEAVKPVGNALPNWHTWSVALDPGEMSGKLTNGGTFSLKHLKPTD